MPEVRPPAPPVRVSPAIGAGGRLPGRVLARRYALALAAILLLGLAKIVIAPKAATVARLTPPEYVVTSGLLIGNAPADTDLEELAVDLKVDGIVNLGSPSVAEQVTAASLHQGYLYLPVAPNTAPTWPQLRELAAFMRGHTAGGTSVYVHDDVGGGRPVAAAAMLLLLRGQALPAVSAELTTAELGSMSEYQRLALWRLSSALHPAGHVPAGHVPAGHVPAGHVPAGHPYAAVRLDPW